MRWMRWLLSGLVILTAGTVWAQCLTCSGNQCVSFVAGGNTCVTGGTPACETKDPCGGNGNCYWDGIEWVCECGDVDHPSDCGESVNAATKAKAEKLWADIQAGEYDNRTVHLSAKCGGYLAVLLTHQGEGELKVQPDRSFTARDGKVILVVHDGSVKTKSQTKPRAKPQQ